ncbi:MAG: hypothetical protein ACOYK6_02820 [Chthoniobacterales bacterium]
MPLSINEAISVSENGSLSLKAKDTQNTARDQAGKIIQWLSPSGKFKGGTLRLVQKSDGTYELQRRCWYHFSFWDTKETALARKLIETLTHQIENVTNQTANQTQPSGENNSSRITTFYNYLTRPSNKIGTREAIETLQKKLLPTLVEKDSSIATETTSDANDNSSILLGSLGVVERIHYRENRPQETFNLRGRLMLLLPKLLNCKITRQDCDQRFSTKATFSFGNPTPFSLQFEDDVTLLPIKKENDLPVFQCGVLAALFAEQNGGELTQLAKPLAVVIALQRETNGALELHYVSAKNTTSFLEEIAAKHPNATAGIGAQIMKSPPGDTLSNLTMVRRDILGWGITTNFNNVMNGLFTHLEQAIKENYFHGNITLDTIIYDNANEGRPLYLINMDAAFCGGRQELSLKRSAEKSSIYKSPRTIATDFLNDSTYGAETDAYSIAMVLLELLDKTCFGQVLKTESFKNNNSFATCVSKEYLNTYLRYASTCPAITINASMPEYMRSKQPDVISELKKYPKVKELIALCFQISEGGKAGKAAFETWKMAFHDWQKQNGFEPVQPIVSN